MNHLPHQPLVLRLAREHQLLAEAEPFAHEGLVEPDRPQVSALAADRDAQHGAAGAGVSLVDVFDHAANALQLALFKLADFPLVAEILVVAREEKEHVAGGVQPHAFQQFRPRWPHALEKLHRRGQQLSGSGGRGRVRSHAAILAGGEGRGERGASQSRSIPAVGGDSCQRLPIEDPRLSVQRLIEEENAPRIWTVPVYQPQDNRSSNTPVADNVVDFIT